MMSAIELSTTPDGERFRVVIVGGGVAALESALALADLAGERTAVTVIAPNAEFVYRPAVVREPFAQAAASRYPLERIIEEAGATLLCDELSWIDAAAKTIHTETGEAISYDALVLATGASPHARYPHALTIDDRDLDETMHGLIQDVEGGHVKKLAFVAAGRMAWPLPLYELALMTAGRAFDAGVELEITIATPEDSPLAIFGSRVSGAVGEILERAGIQMISSAYVEVPHAGEVVINPGDRILRPDRVVALPELFGPSVRGIPLGEHGFIRIDAHCRIPGVAHAYAVGDATEFPVKHGGIGSQQADAAAESIAALAGAELEPEPFKPVIDAMLLTDAAPVYMTARLTGGDGFSAEISETPPSSPPRKIVARYLAPCLEHLDHKMTPA
jgi:sulfide:quinone oxidoreductase